MLNTQAASLAFEAAVATIDAKFGANYAKKNPSLITSYIKSAIMATPSSNPVDGNKVDAHVGR
jgi:hypothetical protein